MPISVKSFSTGFVQQSDQYRSEKCRIRHLDLIHSLFSLHSPTNFSPAVTVVITRATYDDRNGSFRISGKRVCIMGLCKLPNDSTLPFCNCSESCLSLDILSASAQTNALDNQHFWRPCKHQKLATDALVQDWMSREAAKLAPLGIQSRMRIPFDMQAPAEIVTVHLEPTGRSSLDQFSVVFEPRQGAAAIGCVAFITGKCISCESHSGRSQCHHPRVVRDNGGLAAPVLLRAEPKFMIDDESIATHFCDDSRGRLAMRNALDRDLIGFAEQSACDRPAATKPFIVASARGLWCEVCNLEALPGICKYCSQHKFRNFLLLYSHHLSIACN
jgi:hypothetical protein